MKRLISVLLAAVMLLQIPVAAAEKSLPPLFEASFVQGWFCREWTAERFAQELTCMKAAGFRSLILQSTVDLTYRQTDQSRPKTDPSAYTLDTAYALYPSALAAGSEQAYALENALDAAKQTGMQIWIGLVSDDRWWNYGWGEPAAGMQTWLDLNAEQNCTVIREIAALYGDRYAEQIAGFYFTNEYWNVERLGEGTYEMLYALQLETVREQLAAFFPEQRLLLSPFYNQELTDAEVFGGFLVDLVRGGGLRQTDIIALQDGAGHGYDPDTIREWYEMSGKGELQTLMMPTVMSFKPALKDLEPYAYGAVQCEEGPVRNVMVLGVTRQNEAYIREHLPESEDREFILNLIESSKIGIMKNAIGREE